MNNNFIPNHSGKGIYSSSKPSYVIAYLALFFLGWLGVHRYYVRKWFSGFLYMISFGFLGLGVLLDTVLLYFIIKEARQKILPPFPSFKGLLFSLNKEDIAPWAKKETHLLVQLVDGIDSIARILFFFLAPVFIMLFSLYLDASLEIGIFAAFVLVFLGYMGNINYTISAIEQALKKSSTLSQIPFLPSVVGTVREFCSYYYNNKPNNIIYYIFYPIFGGLLLFFSRSARKEFKLYKNLFIVILATLIVESLLSYGSTYQPYLSPFEAIANIIIITIFILFTLITLLMPTITTSFKFRFSGKLWRIRILTTLALFLIVYTFYIDATLPTPPMTLGSELTIESKMNQEKFREDLSITTEMFLSYYYKRVSTLSDNQTLSDKSGIFVHPILTDLYQKHLQSIVANDEFKAFSLFALYSPPESETSQLWLGVHYSRVSLGEIEEPVVLFLISPIGQFYRSWQALPMVIKAQFTLVSPEKATDIDEQTYTPDMISRPILIDEYEKGEKAEEIESVNENDTNTPITEK